jgi:hypothetical protein
MTLTAFHETTRQPRAKISLARATKVIDDKTSLLKPTETKKGGRRKSGFAEEDQAYMFVEEGFRLRFANGEAIDFYADSQAEKDSWMKVLTTLVGSNKDSTSSSTVPGGSKSWCSAVLNRERLLRESAEQVEKARPRSQGMTYAPSNALFTKSQPSSPVKREAQQLPAERRSHGAGGNAATQQPQQQSRPRSQQAVKNDATRASAHNASARPHQSRLGARRYQIKSMIF